MGPLVWRPSGSRTGEQEGLPKAAAVYRAMCRESPCLVIAYMVGERPVVAVVPAQPSPLCISLDKASMAVIKRILVDLGFDIPYLTACRVTGTLLRRGLRETLDILQQFGIIDRLNE